MASREVMRHPRIYGLLSFILAAAENAPPFQLAPAAPSRGIVLIKLNRVGGTTLTSILCRIALN